MTFKRLLVRSPIRRGGRGLGLGFVFKDKDASEKLKIQPYSHTPKPDLQLHFANILRNPSRFTTR